MKPGNEGAVPQIHYGKIALDTSDSKELNISTYRTPVDSKVEPVDTAAAPDKQIVHLGFALVHN
jgi:hypothetical protein